jgi:hypothetical protein
MASFLMPISAEDALRWIVTEQRTAFPAWRAGAARRLVPGDRLFLYTTRGCFRNPTRDRGRVVGVATITSPARPLSRPKKFGGREFPIGVSLTIDRLAGRLDGVELAPLVASLETFRLNPEAWSARMRQALVPVDDHDASRLEGCLRSIAPPYPAQLGSYTRSPTGET